MFLYVLIICSNFVSFGEKQRRTKVEILCRKSVYTSASAFICFFGHNDQQYGRGRTVCNLGSPHLPILATLFSRRSMVTFFQAESAVGRPTSRRSIAPASTPTAATRLLWKRVLRSRNSRMKNVYTVKYKSNMQLQIEKKITLLS